MTGFEKLLDRLELDEAKDFQYFENFADLVETEEKIDFDDLYLLIKDVDFITLSELIEQYFEELLNNLPDSSDEIFSLINTIGMSLAGMARSMEEENDIVLFCEELERFRAWYLFDGVVKSVQGECSVLEALTDIRVEKLEGNIGNNEYDFSECLNYELKEYVVSFKDIMESDYDGEALAGSEGEIPEDGFLYDDEFSDEY